MKWSIAGLIFLGLIAAASASMLVVSFQNPAAAEEGAAEGEVVEHLVEVLVAARDISLRSVITADAIEVRSVPVEARPAEAFSDPVEVVGRVLLVAMNAGQAFTEEAFASEGSGLHLASALAPGTRAVSLILSDKMGIEPLLYPGSNVDVIATMKIDQGSGQRPVSITLLENVLVLGIGKQTIVSPTQGEGGSNSTLNDRTTVTLLVTPGQAQKLKLAMEQGSISLTLRNPMDDEAANEEGTRMGNLAPIFEAAEAREQQLRTLQLEREKEAYARERERAAARKAQQEIDRLRAELARNSEGEQPAEEPEETTWETTIVRGGEVETRSFSTEPAKD